MSDRDPQENMEQIQARWRGDKGDKGDAGQTGAAGAGITPGALRAVIFLFAFTLLLAGLNLLFTSSQVNDLRTSVLTQCRFDADVGSVPVATSPATGQASKLGVSLVSDSRVAWHGLGCPGKLAPPQPSFVKWAKYYHLPIG